MTTNRVENHNGKIKMVLSINSTIADAVEGLLDLLVNKEEDVFYSQVVECMKVAYMTNAVDDPIINEILNDLTKFAAKLLIYELENIPSEDEIHKYESTKDDCNCVFRWSYELPCRHIFQCRRMDGVAVYNGEEIEEMWKRQKNMEEREALTGQFRMKILPPKVQPKTQMEKFRTASQTCKEICSLLSEMGTGHFNECHDVLKKLQVFWAAGKKVTVSELQREGAGNTSTSGTTEHDAVVVLAGEGARTTGGIGEQVILDQEISINPAPITLTIHDADIPSDSAGMTDGHSDVDGAAQVHGLRDHEDESEALSTTTITDNIPLDSAHKPDGHNLVGDAAQVHGLRDHEAESETLSTTTITDNIPLDSAHKLDDHNLVGDAAQVQGLRDCEVEINSLSTSISAKTSCILNSENVPVISVSSQLTPEIPKEDYSTLLDCDDASARELSLLADEIEDSFKSDASARELSLLADEIEDGFKSGKESNLMEKSGPNAAPLEEKDNASLLAELIDELSKAETGDTGRAIVHQTPVKGNSEGKDPSDCTTPIREDLPMCRCRPSMPSQRYIASPYSKMPGRPYYACASRSCNFWRLAKKESGAVKDLRNAFQNITIPTVRAKGRPKGTSKTAKYHFTKSSSTDAVTKPKGAFFSPPQVNQERERRGQAIPDTDVSLISNGMYSVRSQRQSGTVYSVTEFSCNCPDRMLRLSITCKHMHKVRAIIEAGEKDLPHRVVVEHDPTACTTCQAGEPSHSCIKCKRKVHAIPPCSVAPPGEDDEGYGKGRLCKACNVVPHSDGITRKRKAQQDLDCISADDPEAMPLSQTTRSGRIVSRKKPYTPTK